MSSKVVRLAALLDKARVALSTLPTTNPSSEFKTVDSKIKELTDDWRTRKNANNKHWADIRAAKKEQPIDKAKIETGVKLHTRIRELLWLCVDHWNKSRTEYNRRENIQPEPDPNRPEYDRSLIEIKALLESMNLQTLKEFHKANKYIWISSRSKKTAIEKWMGNYDYSFKQGIRK